MTRRIERATEPNHAGAASGAFAQELLDCRSGCHTFGEAQKISAQRFGDIDGQKRVFPASFDPGEAVKVLSLGPKDLLAADLLRRDEEKVFRLRQ